MFWRKGHYKVTEKTKVKSSVDVTKGVVNLKYGDLLFAGTSMHLSLGTGVNFWRERDRRQLEKCYCRYQGQLQVVACRAEGLPRFLGG